MKKVLCSWESPFADCLSGAPGGDYLSRAIVPCREHPLRILRTWVSPPCRWITITGMIAHPRCGAQRYTSSGAGVPAELPGRASGA